MLCRVRTQGLLYVCAQSTGAGGCAIPWRMRCSKQLVSQHFQAGLLAHPSQRRNGMPQKQTGATLPASQRSLVWHAVPVAAVVSAAAGRSRWRSGAVSHPSCACTDSAKHHHGSRLASSNAWRTKGPGLPEQQGRHARAPLACQSPVDLRNMATVPSEYPYMGPRSAHCQTCAWAIQRELCRQGMPCHNLGVIGYAMPQAWRHRVCHAPSSAP